ncbi:unnamed protein product [Urochloa decumbens]|uniref:Uncharacterized protein n=1 Tax=Urochloa decumbens TaxID=240449 RepID=A0ABC8ZDJ4_9POAL
MGFPPYVVWSTCVRRLEVEDPHAKLGIPKLARLYAEAVASDGLYFRMEEGLYLTPRPPPAQQQEQPLLSDAARKALNIFCRGFIIAAAIVLMVFIFMMTSLSPTKPEQLNPYQSAYLVAVVLLVAGITYTVFIPQEVEEAGDI